MRNHKYWGFRILASLFLFSLTIACTAPAPTAPLSSTHAANLPNQNGNTPSTNIAIPTTNPAPSVHLPLVNSGSQLSQGAQPANANFYLVALGDNGQSGKQIGCGDSLMAVPIQVPPSEDPVLASLQALFSINTQTYGSSGLYNALYQSHLKVESFSATPDGKATLQLSGDYLLGGECDDPRFKAQIEEVVLQFQQYKEVSVFINGKPLNEIVSGRGESATGSPEAQAQDAKIFLIALEDNGKSGTPVGCGDSSVPVQVTVPASSDQTALLREVLENLLSTGDKYASSAGLYNALKNSALKIEGINVQNGTATVQLSGALQMGGECDIPRVEAQLEETAGQFPQFSQFSQIAILVNSQPLKDALSLK